MASRRSAESFAREQAQEEYLETLLRFQEWCEDRRLPWKYEMQRLILIKMKGVKMGFEVFTPLMGPKGVQPGQVNLCANGHITIHKADLDATGISDLAVVMVDKQTFRVALRKRRDSDPVVKVKLTKNRGAGKLNIAGAVKLLGIEPTKLRLDLSRRDDLLVIQFPMPKAK